MEEFGRLSAGRVFTPVYVSIFYNTVCHVIILLGGGYVFHNKPNKPAAGICAILSK
jgi:hypothetical protein